MLNNPNKDSSYKEGVKPDAGTKNTLVTPPTVSLPKGGGAIRGIGEKFAANPVTGTGSMTVPIATSPGRSGFGPQLALAYESGAGNGPFGLGWSLSLPAITRKTDKGLPRYNDGQESDVFILSGAEDLVPVLKLDAVGNLELDADGGTQFDEFSRDGYRVRRYRPRIEGLFARIERWTKPGHPEDTFWRSISRANITTWYGKTKESRILDPTDETRIFSWLICESYDDKGNAIHYKYKEENSDGVDLSAVSERNRSRTAQRYLKRIKYGNKTPRRSNEDLAQRNDWMFEVVFDYGEHYTEDDQGQPTTVYIEDTQRNWPVRKDPFSSYRAGFEVRTYRLCQRVLMFHHFDELGIKDYLVRATQFTIFHDPALSFITAVTQSGYLWQADTASYLKKSLPSVEFEYSKAHIDETIHDIEDQSLENLPYGLDGARYQWVDLDGEGLSGILTEQGGAWFYKRNLSALPVSETNDQSKYIARFAPVESLVTMPSPENLSGGQQLLDLAGDGQLDVVEFDGPMPGFFERTTDEGWETFTAFASLPNIAWKNPNLKFVDLTGDGHADILITEDEVFTWYPSLAEEGFGPAEIVRQTFDEDAGPHLVFADSTQSIYLSDLSGDGLTDLVRIRNGEVCFWPNLGYGRFGSKVTMDNAPWFETPDLFDGNRIRLADIDGSGVTDLIYLASDGVQLYFNQAGNSWSAKNSLDQFPRVDDLSSVVVLDLLGNGTACLVWSSPLPAQSRRPMRYIDLMGGQKPHLLIKTKNNLGATIKVKYAPSTKFYLQDKDAGKPWTTRLLFPVHVVERVDTFDHISNNRFVTCYAYHHGYFDGFEREFRGFGMIEQRDTEEFAALSRSGALTEATNSDAASHVPPVLTKTWFHTGIYLGRDHVSNFFAGTLDENDPGEYFRELGLRDSEARKLLLDDTVLPANLTVEEEREACRALKGSMLRQEVYALDGTDRAGHPYTVTEQNFSIRRLQAKAENRHAVFFTHAHESISYNYERTPTDPRIAHAMTLEVDKFGNVLKSAAVGYGRRTKILVVDEQGVAKEILNPNLNKLDQPDQDKQTTTLITYTENRVTEAIESADDNYRTPLSCESRAYELTGYTPTGEAGRFQFADFVLPAPDDRDKQKQIHIFDSEIAYEDNPTNGKQRRLIEHFRTLYRTDDLTAFLQLGELDSLALPGESYNLAFTPQLLTRVYKRGQENLLPTPATMLGGMGGAQGGYVDLDNNGQWWIPSGRMFYDGNANAGNPAATAAQELAQARQHFFLPRKYIDPFGQDTYVEYDKDRNNNEYDLLVTLTRDALGNEVKAQNDYRVLAPRLMTDPNGNRSEVAFDALGMVVATAVKGKDGQNLGDLLEDFDPDPQLTALQAFVADPRDQTASQLLGKATTRIVYDLDRFKRSGQPPLAATLARETHFFDPGGAQTKIQISFSYSDGFGREVQKKIEADGGQAPQRAAAVALPSGDVRPGTLVRNNDDKLVEVDTSPRWVGSGRTVFNNKGKPVRQYEPFFSSTHLYEDESDMTDTGVSPTLFYDPVERVVATLHPNHTWEKVVFNPWQQTTYDVNDTVLNADGTTDPKSDQDVKEYFSRLPDEDYLPTWYEQRIAMASNDPERLAADKAAVHRQTPAVVHLDTLGRIFLTVAHNRFERNNAIVEEKYPTRVMLDIEGNQREVRDAIVQAGDQQGRIVMRYDYDMRGNRIYQTSMEAGERWMLNDVTGNLIRAWNSRKYAFRSEYDALRRPLRLFVQGGDPNEPNTEVFVTEILSERTIYGEQHPQAQQLNLRGKLFMQLDGAGVVTNSGKNSDKDDPEAYDFKGNLLHSSRRLARQYKQAVDWKAVEPSFPTDVTSSLDLASIENALGLLLEENLYLSSTTFDALNRPLTMAAPDGSVYRPTYNEANLLDKVQVNLLGAANATPFVTNIDYNAKGQRTLIQYHNGAETTHEYEKETFRLMHLKTTRGPGQNGLASQIFTNGTIVQDLRYTYDPAGNITRIADDARPVITNDNQKVEPVCDYTYDAIYRLIEARGREHIGQMEFDFDPPSGNFRDYPFAGSSANPNDLQALRNYIERYEYDPAGNFEKLIHQAGPNSSWTRTYAYSEPSLVETATTKNSNRLSSTTIGQTTENYAYDAHGNMIRMRHLTLMQWNFKDQLHATSRQVVNATPPPVRMPETTFYVYDAGGQRIRKVTERQNGTRKEERVYLGGFEIYREFNSDVSVRMERETLHVMDDRQRIAMVETKTFDNSIAITAPVPRQRYQFSNHLGSATLELDESGGLISYEEYHPYGTTSYQAMNGAAEVSVKRYRYTGMERDEESGWNYHGARYYAAWLGRWTNCDPEWAADGLCSYAYSKGSPLGFTDPDGRQAKKPEDTSPQIDPTATRQEDPELQAFEKGSQLGQIVPFAEKSDLLFPPGKSATLDELVEEAKAYNIGVQAGGDYKYMGAAAYYDPKLNVIVVPSEHFSTLKHDTAFKSIFAHELTHAVEGNRELLSFAERNPELIEKHGVRKEALLKESVDRDFILASLTLSMSAEEYALKFIALEGMAYSTGLRVRLEITSPHLNLEKRENEVEALAPIYFPTSLIKETLKDARKYYKEAEAELQTAQTALFQREKEASIREYLMSQPRDR